MIKFTSHFLPILSYLPLLLSAPNEFKLIHNLIDNYNRLVRPVDDVNKPVLVQLSVTLQQLIDVDEKNQIVTMNVWLKYVRSCLL